MSRMMVIDKPESIFFEEYEEMILGPEEVRIRTLYSGISAGTELTAYRGTNPKVKKRWNSALRIFEPLPEGSTSSWYPIRGGVGYECVGEVVELGSEAHNVKLGQIIYGAWGHRSTCVKTEQYAAEHLLPEGTEPLYGIFAQMGAIAFNAILDANIHLGETVVIFGQGVPGQMAAQLARLNGAFVVAVDVDDYRLDISKKMGADVILNSAMCDVGKEIRSMTEGRGADVCIEISGFAPALHEAIRTVAYNGRVVVSGFYQGTPDGLFLGEEFHLNRIHLVCSQIENVSPELSYRWNRIRKEKIIMDLQNKGKVDFKGLITHIIPFEKAGTAFDMLDKAKEKYLQTVLSFE